MNRHKINTNRYGKKHLYSYRYIIPQCNFCLNNIFLPDNTPIILPYLKKYDSVPYVLDAIIIVRNIEIKIP